MKKCPTCDKTFDDSMRFCQTDGTPLVEDAPAFDPYATIVAQPRPVIEPEPEQAAPVVEAEEVHEEAPAMAAEEPEPYIEEPAAPVTGEIEVEPIMHQTVGSLPIAEPDDVLDLPQSDPLKTMYVSDAEMQAALGVEQPEPNEPEIMEIPPVEPEPPSFIASEVPPSSFEQSPPPSPFSAPDAAFDDPADEASSFSEPVPAPPVFEEPAAEPSEFQEAATMIQSGFTVDPPSPFADPPPVVNVPDPPPPSPIAEWTPPPVPDANWQNQEIGSNTPFQPPPAGASNPSSVLAIVSLILSIVGLIAIVPTFIFLLCGIFPFILGIAAMITGFLGRSRANSSPAEYGGKGMATTGIVFGVIDLLAPFAVLALTILLWGGMAALGSMSR